MKRKASYFTLKMFLLLSFMLNFVAFLDLQSFHLEKESWLLYFESVLTVKCNAGLCVLSSFAIIPLRKG